MILWKKAFKAIATEKVSGWLFYNFQHRDPLADRILEISPQMTNSRPWIYLLFVHKTPIKIVHQIEASILDHLPGDKEIYGDRKSFLSILKKHAHKRPRVALHYSESYPQLSFVDHGTALFLSKLGFRLSSAGNLLQRVLSTLSYREIELHEQAAKALYKIIHEVWRKIKNTFSRKNTHIYEGEIFEWINKLFKTNNLITDSPLIVGSGKNTTLPHYTPQGKGARLKPGQIVQLDIWGKLDTPEGIYADISWVGILASTIPKEAEKVFNTIIKARDAAVEFIARTLEKRKKLNGEEVDLYTEEILKQAGYPYYIKHRTGHAIDREVHGFGVNLDAKEFPDKRLIREGSCFSIEPGIYLKDFGMRTEINVYIKHNIPVISGGNVQTALLTL
jgi:Xaa-Pro dipeptidase